MPLSPAELQQLKELHERQLENGAIHRDLEERLELRLGTTLAHDLRTASRLTGRSLGYLCRTALYAYLYDSEDSPLNQTQNQKSSGGDTPEDS